MLRHNWRKRWTKLSFGEVLQSFWRRICDYECCVCRLRDEEGVRAVQNPSAGQYGNGTVGVTERCLAASHDEHLVGSLCPLCIHLIEESLHYLRLKPFCSHLLPVGSRMDSRGELHSSVIDVRQGCRDRGVAARRAAVTKRRQNPAS